jgi:RsiW-degrading membrane proteinase PrsW (M82 family)
VAAVFEDTLRTESALLAPVGLLPVMIFLVVLVYLDSYKLVRLHTVLWVIGLGALTAICSYFVNGWLIDIARMEFISYSRYVSPLVEEGLKGLVMVYLFRSNRIGFLVDSAIFGFAVGAGFSVVENFYYLYSGAGSHIGVWVVRGFGTAIMHGGVTAIFGVMAQTLTERSMKINPAYYLPGFLLASVLHSVFNHFPGSPVLATVGTLLILPLLLYGVFQRSAKAMHVWLEVDFDADAELLEQIISGEFTQTKIGIFLSDLRAKFDGPVVADMLCYLRIYTELAIRAKSVLLMRENGLEVTVDERTHEKFEELRYLERSIGKTGCLAMKPFLQMERKDLWQMNVLE